MQLGIAYAFKNLTTASSKGYPNGIIFGKVVLEALGIERLMPPEFKVSSKHSLGDEDCVHQTHI